jgi:hypothetical protein
MEGEKGVEMNESEPALVGNREWKPTEPGLRRRPSPSTDSCSSIAPMLDLLNDRSLPISGDITIDVLPPPPLLPCPPVSVTRLWILSTGMNPHGR